MKFVLLQLNSIWVDTQLYITCSPTRRNLNPLPTPFCPSICLLLQSYLPPPQFTWSLSTSHLIWSMSRCPGSPTLCCKSLSLHYLRWLFLPSLTWSCSPGTWRLWCTALLWEASSNSTVLPSLELPESTFTCLCYTWITLGYVFAHLSSPPVPVTPESSDLALSNLQHSV